MAADFVICISSFWVSDLLIRTGDLYEADDPLVVAHPRQFTSVQNKSKKSAPVAPVTAPAVAKPPIPPAPPVPVKANTKDGE